MRNQSGFHRGFTLVEIMIVVAIIGLLATIASPAYFRARKNSQTKTMANNLRQLEAAIDQWSLDNGKKDGDSITTLSLAAYIKGNTVPLVPLAGCTYGFNN